MATINRLLLPVKLHYLLYFGSLAGSIPFLMTYALQLGASPSTLGVLYATLPFLVMLAKPLLGGIADKFRQHKTVFVACIALMISGYFSVYFIPSSPHSSSVGLGVEHVSILHCRNDNFFYLKTKCDSSASSINSACNVTCHSLSAVICNGTDELCRMDELASTSDWKAEGPFFCENNGWMDIPASPMYKSEHDNCDMFPEVTCTLKCSAASSNSSGHDPESDEKRIFGVNAYILMLWLCMCVANVGMGVSLSLADALVLDLLGDDQSNYGIQRLWGSIGWGTFSIVAGQLIDLASAGHRKLDFSPGFYLTLVLGLLDIVVASRIKVIKTSRPKHIARDVGQLMLNPRVVVFVVVAFVVGIFTGVMWTFLIVFLFQLGASQLLIGLTMATSCFLGELPFFFVSSWFLKKLGHVYSVILALFVFGIRFLLYSMIVNPWTVLPIETLNGFTYGIFFTALATYSSHIAPPGMSATVQGILQGVYEGFGVGVGCLAGGILFERWGGATTFFICGVFAVCCSILLYVANRFIEKYAPLPKARPIAIEIPEIRRDNNKEDGAMLSYDGVAA